MAGKRIKGATITFEVTDDGTLRQVGQKAKGAKKGLDGVNKSTKDVNRNMQAMSGRVESGTKGFARMQQGTGGLVQTYAILASTLFAVGAAFRALENAANIQNQIKGFKELAAITGTSMLSTTAAVREATGGLLEFQAASQQVAIATAAGFSKDQIVGLAEGAKLASVALGRDMTDSYNRLIRGVTKAEPELLDELGIILRLDIATRKFAASQGLVAEKLTIAQRRMAVYNEVNKQLQENFGAFGSEADEYLNGFTRFATTISDVAKDIGGFVTTVLEPFAAFLDRSSGFLGILLGVIAFKMLQQVVPATQNMTQAVTNFKNKAVSDLEAYDIKIQKITAQQKKAGKVTKTVENSVSAAFKKELKKRGVADKFFQMKRTQDQKAHITKYLKSLPKKTNAEKAAAKKIEIMYRAAYKKIEMVQKQGVTKQMLSLKKVGLGLEKFVMIPALKAKQGVALLGAGLLKLAPVMRIVGAAASSLMSVLMVLMTFDFVMELFSSGYRETKEALADLKDQNKKLTDETSESLNILAGLFQNSKKAMEDGKIETYEAAAAIKFLGNALNNLGNLERVKKELDDINKQILKAQDGFMNFGRAEKKGMETAAEYLKNQVVIALTDPKAQKDVADALQNLLPETLPQMKSGVLGGVDLDSVLTPTLLEELEAAFDILGDKDREQEGILALENALGGFSEELFTNSGLLARNDDGLVKITDSGTSFLEKLRELTEESRTAGNAILGLEETADNLRQSLDQILPKPTLFSSFVSGFAKIQNEIKEGGLDSYQLTLPGAKEAITGEQAIVWVLTKRLGLSEAAAEALANQLSELTNVFLKTDELLRKEKQYLSVLDTQKKRMMFFDTALTRRKSKELDLEKITAQRLRAEGELEAKREIHNKLNDTVTDAMEDALHTQLATTEALRAQEDILAAQLNIAKELMQTLVKAFDTAGTTALKDLFIGDKETGDIKDKLGKDLRDASAGFFANKTMEFGQSMIMKIPGMDKVGKAFGIGEMSKEAKDFLEVHKEHIDGMAIVLDQHVKGVATATGSTTIPTVTSPTGDQTPKPIDTTSSVVKDITDGTTQSVIEDVTTEGIVSGKNKGLSSIFGKFGSIFDTFGSNLMGIFKGDGTGIFGKGSGGVNSLFGDLFGSIFGGKGVSGLFGGPGGLLSGIFGLERGGVIGLAKGGMMPRYADGGVATQPTYLVGEGKQNEAVVPLPDNRSIPVNLKGGGGTTNTSINVNIDQSGTSSDITSDEGGALGAMLDAAVQQTLERELRPGGILGG